jgi:putative membrane-bound dehydrogenase-like protein
LYFVVKTPTMRHLSLFVLSLVVLNACQKEKPGIPPPPTEAIAKALAQFEIADGFKIEAVAAEPLVQDPVAMEIDEQGRMYVVEMSGYPLDLSKKGRVKLLKDTNGDGYPDQAVVFADSLTLPTGIMRWREGILVTDPPHVLYLADTNGDDVADVRKVMLTGFALSNPQHNLNTPVFGLDNWIYLAHQWAFTPTVCKEFSDEGSEIRFPDMPGTTTLGKNADDRNVRFKPDVFGLEALSSESQFGQTFDAWGRHLQTENGNHIYQEILGARYLKQNPNLLVPDVIESISDHGEACEVFPITEKPDHQLLTDVGVITSACGITTYLGGAFPEPYGKNTVFVAEPSHNLVHVDRISENGAALKASRIIEKGEFLRSKDAWFRPVNFYVGPDGAMYVVDYYRQIIEHPEWMSDEVNKSGKLYNGSDKGRIYRIVPKKGLPMDWCGKLKLKQLKDEELIPYLESANIWWRRTAQRLLYERKSKAIEPLREFAVKTKSVEGRVHAMWLLEGLRALTEPILVENLKHPEAGVRENALKIADTWLETFPGLGRNMTDLKNDPSPRVRFQLLNSCSYVKGEAAEEAQITILARDIEDKWVQLAAIAAMAGKEQRLLTWAENTFSGKLTEAEAQFFSYLAATIANSKDQKAIATLFKGHSAAAQAAIFSGLQQLWDYFPPENEQAAALQDQLLTYFDPQKPANLRQSALDLLQTLGLNPGAALNEKLGKAKMTLADPKADASFKAHAVQLLSAYSADDIQKDLLNLIKAPAENLQMAALQGLSQCNGEAATAELTKVWLGFSPNLKAAAIDVFLSSPQRCQQLLAAVEKKTINPDEIGWRRMVRLMNNDDVGVREVARKVLASGGMARESVFSTYHPALGMKGDATKGKAIFQRACQICHKMQDQGVEYGPNLGSVRNRQPESILKEILIPNNSIADKYEVWNLELNNGKLVQGIITSKNAQAVSIRQLSGQVSTYPRSEIKKMEASPISGMPNGLEATITVSEMSDLLAFIKSEK